MTAVCTFDISEFDAMRELAEALALALRPGDVLAVSGDLGTGKTTLLRALIQTFADQSVLEVPSPTYTLMQSYGEGLRFPLHHVDLYRLKSAGELEELGLDEALEQGALLVEWPERAGKTLPEARIDLHLALTEDTRTAAIGSGDEGIVTRLKRLCAVKSFLQASPAQAARRRFLQGDASPRAYERLALKDGGTLVLLNAQAQPDRSVGEHRLNYMKITHLAPNDAIAPILAIGAELRKRGFTVPRHLHYDIENSLLLQEDLGNVFIAENGAPISERYETAVDALVHLHAQDWPEVAQGPAGTRHAIPVYSREAFQTEAKLFLEFFLPLMQEGGRTEAGAEFRAAFDALFDILLHAPTSWTLFDFHSPNAMWLNEREGIARIGIIDFQDTRRGPEAYDLVSLTQDARVSVPSDLEQALLQRYIQKRKSLGEDFDADSLLPYYAICGAQRATRILGVFARLAYQDAKPHYLKHIPRVSDYLDRCLKHPVTLPLKNWFDRHAPSHLRVKATAAA